MFRKNNKNDLIIDYILPNGERCIIDKNALVYIKETIEKIERLKNENYRLSSELKAIKPVVESADYKPALSADCQDCIYCVKSRWSGEILGCRKDNICEDFKRGEKEE